MKWVVIHSAVMPCEPGRARQLGQMNSAGSGGGSWHYATDPGAVIQCSWDSFVCWHCGHNDGSLAIEMADWPTKTGTVQTWRWRRDNHKKMLWNTAMLTAHLCAAYDLPPKFRSPYGLMRNRKGVTTHWQMTLAFRKSTHWDPGLWPKRRFMRMVRTEHARLIAGGKPRW